MVDAGRRAGGRFAPRLSWSSAPCSSMAHRPLYLGCRRARAGQEEDSSVRHVRQTAGNATFVTFPVPANGASQSRCRGAGKNAVTDPAGRSFLTNEPPAQLATG